MIQSPGGAGDTKIFQLSLTLSRRLSATATKNSESEPGSHVRSRTSEAKRPLNPIGYSGEVWKRVTSKSR